MSHDNLTYEDLLQIVELIKSSEQFSEFRLKIGEIEIEVRRARGDNVPISDATEAPTVPAAPSKAANARGDVSAGGATTATDAPTKPSPRRPPALPPGSIVVSAPMVGTFYRSPSPGAPPFVEPGARVERDTVVCIIEVMKLMNSIRAGVAGTVREIRVENGEPVEFGQVLLVIEPDR